MEKLEEVLQVHKDHGVFMQRYKKLKNVLYTYQNIKEPKLARNNNMDNLETTHSPWL